MLVCYLVYQNPDIPKKAHINGWRFASDHARIQANYNRAENTSRLESAIIKGLQPLSNNLLITHSQTRQSIISTVEALKESTTR